MNQAFWLGVGTPGSVVPEDSSPYNPGPEWRTKWSTLDVKTANEMLDKIGLDKKDSEGFRVRTDNGQRLRLEIMAPGGAIVPFTPHVEMVAQHWKKIGIQADVKETERGLSMTRVGANEHQIMSWSVSGSEHLLLYPDNTLPVLPTNSYRRAALRQVVRVRRNGREEAIRSEDHRDDGPVPRRARHAH